MSLLNQEKEQNADPSWPALIARVRKAHGLKQEALAFILGVSQGSISRWESGLVQPSAGYQRQIFDLLQQKDEPVRTVPWENLIGALPILALLVDSDGCILVSSDMLPSLIGQPKPDVEGRYVNRLFSGHLAQIEEVFNFTRFYSGHVSKVETTGPIILRDDPDGHEIAFEHSIHWPYFCGGDVVRHVMQGRLISRQESAEIHERLGAAAKITFF